MGRNYKINLSKYNEICPLPPWAYSDTEVRECIKQSDIIVNNRFYRLKPIPEPDEISDFVDDVLKGN